MSADLQGLIEELRKNQEEIRTNKERSDANLHGRINELEKKLEEYNIERQQVEARLREIVERNIKREEVVATLRGRITALEGKLKEIDLVREEVKATFSGYTINMESDGTDAEAIEELVKKPQESDGDSRHVDFDLSGHFQKLMCRDLEFSDYNKKLKCSLEADANWEDVEDEIFPDPLEDVEYFEEPERREPKMESEFAKMFHDENKKLKNDFERTPRYVAYIIIPFLSVFFKDYKETRIPWKFFGFLRNFTGFGMTEDYEVATPTG